MSYFNKRYGPATKVGKDLGNIHAGDGALFHGRGYAQITGRKNYRHFGIEDEPEKALEPETAYRIISEGMHEGSFTGHKLSDYVNDKETDYHNARRVINGTDRADEIAAMANKFSSILAAALTNDTSVPVVPAAPEAPKTEPTTVVVPREDVSKKSAIATIGTAITGALTTLGVGFSTLKEGIKNVNPTIIAYLALGVALVIVGLYFYDKAKQRADARQAKLIEKAASPTENTVRLQ